MCQTEEMMQAGNKFERNFYYEYGTCKMVKTGLQKDDHVCDMFLWSDENLVNLEKNNCYKNEVCTFSDLQHYSW